MQTPSGPSGSDPRFTSSLGVNLVGAALVIAEGLMLEDGLWLKEGATDREGAKLGYVEGDGDGLWLEEGVWLEEGESDGLSVG